MTVCIAAACQDHGEPRIVLCFDSRLDFGELGSLNTAYKLKLLGAGWVALMAGDWTAAPYVSGLIADRITKKRPKSVEGVCSCIKAAVSKYRSSPIYAPGRPVGLIISGFAYDRTPHIITVSNNPPDSEEFDVSMAHNNMSTVGSGTAIASVLLTAREVHPLMPLPAVAYKVYEAKKCSEKSGAVGQETTIIVQAPFNQETLHLGCLQFMHPAMIEGLDHCWASVWKMRLDQVLDFPADWFLSKEELLSSVTVAERPPE